MNAIHGRFTWTYKSLQLGPSLSFSQSHVAKLTTWFVLWEMTRRANQAHGGRSGADDSKSHNALCS